MKPVKVNSLGIYTETSEDFGVADLPVRRLNGRSGNDDSETPMQAPAPTPHSHTKNRSPFFHNTYAHVLSPLSQHLRALGRRWCPPCVQTSAAEIVAGWSSFTETCQSTAAAKSPRWLLHIFFWLAKVWEMFCAVVVSAVQSFTRPARSSSGLATATAAAAAHSSNGSQKGFHAAPHGHPQRHHHLCSTVCTPRVWCGVVAFFVLLLVPAFLLLASVYAGLLGDPYYEMRLQLRVAYRQRTVEAMVRSVKERRSQLMRMPAGGAQVPRATPVGQFVYAATMKVREMTENAILAALSGILAARRRNATAEAAAWMSLLLAELRIPQLAMIGETPGVRTTLQYDATEIPSNATTMAQSVSDRMLDAARSAVLRCVHGVPTLSPHHAGHPNDYRTSEAILDSLWSSFARKPSTPAVQPHCLDRSQIRMPCADVGLPSHTGRASTEEEEVSRVQHLFEHRRVGVTDALLTSLYFDTTPALPVESHRWRTEAIEAQKVRTLHNNNNNDINDHHNISARAQLLAERFQRGTATNATTLARSFSGVILFLSGAADRNPEGRDNDFTQHALPLLENHLLRQFPYYPVHIFYEAPSILPSSSPASQRPAWTLTDVLRHSDVYTIVHTYDARNATRVHDGLRVHVAPPPPVLVDGEARLPVMHAQHAIVRPWFEQVAARIPSAPYVTFENVAPLFSTLPCGVTEDDVSAWVRDPCSPARHRRGYRQMCRFWARLVWRLPSLRIWTDSTEGQQEMNAYADPLGGMRISHPQAAAAAGAGAGAGGASLPPWRFRYSYYLRLDTDSYLHRPLVCDPFVTMARQRCAYGYNALVRDVHYAVWNLGSAMTEWIDSRTSIRVSERKEELAAATVAPTSVSAWGRLTDPSLSSIVTLTTKRKGKAQTLLADPLPPLPPTWPWFNVYPEHSSLALSAAEKDVLRAYFFTNLVALWGGEDVEVHRRMVETQSPPQPPMEPLPPLYARARSYNRAMYFNNFELGTFALKNHPLYNSVTEFLDNRDYDDVTGPEREAAAFDCTLRALKVTETSVRPGGKKTVNVYPSPVYVLEVVYKAKNAPRQPHAVKAAAGVGGGDERHAALQCRGRRRHANSTITGELNDEEMQRLRLSARDVERDWRSGYLQYRWGDAPVHTFGVEAVMQREGWGVCAFSEDLGWYEHGQYEER